MIFLLIIILFIPVILQTSKNIDEKKKSLSKFSNSSAGTVRFWSIFDHKMCIHEYSTMYGQTKL